MLFVQLFIHTLLAFAASDNCANVKNYRVFFECSLQKHPKIAIAEQKAREGEAVVEKAVQWQNPELAVKSVGGTQAGEQVGTTELSIAIPISQIWTRGSQKRVGLAEKKIIELDSRQIILEVKEELIRDAYRLRQIEDDQELVSETLTAFDLINKQLSARRARGPDQEITLNLVKLATSDYLLKRNHLQVEKAELLSKFKAIWGNSFELKEEFLPPLKERWPEVKIPFGLAQNLSVQKALASTDKAAAEYRLARGESWPSVSLGPVMERSTTGPNQSWAYGFNLTVSLPIFSWNSGARTLTEARFLQAELESNYAINKFHSEKDILIQRYRSAVDSLAKASNRDDIKKRHNQVDSYFRQGLASGGLVIEAHRQLVEYMNSQHEHENVAIDSYIDLMTLTGGTIEGIL